MLKWGCMETGFEWLLLLLRTREVERMSRWERFQVWKGGSRGENEREVKR